MSENFSNILQARISLNASCGLACEETAVKRAPTWGRTPANLAAAKTNTCPASTVPHARPVRKPASSPGLMWSYLTVMFLQNVKFKTPNRCKLLF